MAHANILAGLAEADAEAILALGEPVAAVAGTRLISHDETEDDLFLILDGAAAVTVDDPAATMPVRVATLRDGDTYGEVAFLRGARRIADVRAITDIRALRFPKARLVGWLDAHPAVAAAFYKALACVVADRLIDTTMMRRNV